MDFFSILLPGALLTFLLMDKAGPVILGKDIYDRLAGAVAWVTFLVASYVSGHLIFLLGSWLDEIYDWVRGYTLNTQIWLVAHRNRLLPWPARMLIWLIFKRERNLAVNRAVKIKGQTLSALHAKDSVNTFQWGKIVLAAEGGKSLGVVQRFEADSKFFRCLVVVLLVLLTVWLLQGNWPLAIIGTTLIPLAWWRYMEQRFKATNQVYWSVIALTAREGKITLQQKGSGQGNLTHAGGVVFRLRRGQPEYLLVEAKKDPRVWVLPKGHVEEGEDTRETAVREVHEETGVWARIAEKLDKVSYPVDGAVITVQLFLMEYMGRGRRTDINRKHTWLPLADAMGKAEHPETKKALESGEEKRTSRTLLDSR